MSDMQLYIHSIIILLPVFSAMTCLLLMLFSQTDNLTITDRQIKFAVAAYFFFDIIVWISLFCYVFFPVAFVWLNTLLLLSYMLVPVLLYRIIFTITEEGNKKRFSRWHYAAPVLFSTVLTVKHPALLFKQAGFSDSKHYLRTLRAEEKPEEKKGGDA